MTEKLSLTELQLIIRDSLYLSLPHMFWIIAEISEISVNSSGHCYLELIEKHPDEKNVSARIKGIIWSSRYSFIKSFFENITGEYLKSGLKILVKAKVEYHELYGLSLIISDIDPAFTIGEMAIKRQLVIKMLEQEGVFSMNKEIDFPLLPQKIVIISSKSAAGYSDFINQLNGNSFGYVFYTALIETPMQGTETEQGVISALDKIAVNSSLFDLVVIIRGGGSQTDLSWFDNYNIAYHVTQFPLPVITGIGHEKDMSVTDMVANKSLKTPTAVADFIIDAMSSAENQLLEMSSEIRDLGKEYTSKAGLVAANHSSRLVSSARSFSFNKVKAAERSIQSLIAFTLNSLNRNNTRLLGLENTLHILKPENVLKRGYTITSLNGRILKKRMQLKKEDVIDTLFRDGTVSSIVVGRHENDKKE